MNLYTASKLLVRDRRDWLRPHLPWLSSKLYRNYLSRHR